MGSRIIKLSIISLVFYTLTIVALPLMVPFAEGAGPKKYKWKFFNNGPAVMPTTPFNIEFCEKVKERSNGRLNIKIYMAGELPYKHFDVLPVVQARKVEVGSVWDTHSEGVQDWYSVLTMPTIFFNRAEALKMNEEVVMPFMDKVLRKNLGIIPLARSIWGTSDMPSNKKLTSIADIKGQKIRCSGMIQQNFIRELGGFPMRIDIGETYTALQKGTVNGGLVVPIFANAGKWFEVCKWLYIWDLMQMAEGVYVNEAAFNELPQDLQEVILTTAKEMNKKKLAKAIELNENAIEQARTMHNVTVTYISDSDRANVQKVGDRILEDWLKGSKTSDDAKNLCDLIEKAKR